MERLFIDPKYQPLFARLGWNSCDETARQFLTPDLKRRGETIVLRGVMADTGIDVFFKDYAYPTPAWQFLGRASKARREFDNYGVFARLGIPAAERIACAEQRDPLGRLKRAFIITREVPNARTLVEYFQSAPTRVQRRAVADQLATMADRLHSARFFYHDFVWRNVLVTLDGGELPQLRLIDCPRGAFAQWSAERKRLRDLASLDKSAAKFCTRTERLRFLLRYLSKSRLDPGAKRLARDCLEFRRRRWPEDWAGK